MIGKIITGSFMFLSFIVMMLVSIEWLRAVFFALGLIFASFLLLLIPQRQELNIDTSDSDEITEHLKGLHVYG